MIPNYMLKVMFQNFQIKMKVIINNGHNQNLLQNRSIFKINFKPINSFFIYKLFSKNRLFLVKYKKE